MLGIRNRGPRFISSGMTGWVCHLPEFVWTLRVWSGLSLKNSLFVLKWIPVAVEGFTRAVQQSLFGIPLQGL